MLAGRLLTADKQIELAPDVLVKDVERVKAKFAGEMNGVQANAGETPAVPGNAVPVRADLGTNGHLLLIGRRQLRSNNSWMHNSERLLRGKPRCTILMNPVDAAERKLGAGQEVSVRSRVGSVVLPIEISEEMMPGVVSIPHGWGHDRLGIQIGVAQQHAGESINDITDELTVDALCGTAAFNGTWVTVDGTN